MSETEIIALIVSRAKHWEQGNWLQPPNWETAGALWGIAHDIECDCDDSTVNHLDDYRSGKFGVQP